MKVKDHNGVTGNGRRTCKFYDKLDAILGHRPASAPSVLMDAGSSNLPTAESHSQSQDDPEEDGNIHVTILTIFISSLDECTHFLKTWEMCKYQHQLTVPFFHRRQPVIALRQKLYRRKSTVSLLLLCREIECITLVMF